MQLKGCLVTCLGTMDAFNQFMATTSDAGELKRAMVVQMRDSGILLGSNRIAIASLREFHSQVAAALSSARCGRTAVIQESKLVPMTKTRGKAGTKKPKPQAQGYNPRRVSLNLTLQEGE